MTKMSSTYLAQKPISLFKLLLNSKFSTQARKIFAKSRPKVLSIATPSILVDIRNHQTKINYP